MMKKPTDGLKTSLCEICEEKEAHYVCRLCKRKVCEDDFNKERGICKVCEMSICEICNENLSIGYCEICGRLICEKCTAYSNGTSRICVGCISKINKDKN